MKRYYQIGILGLAVLVFAGLYFVFTAGDDRFVRAESMFRRGEYVSAFQIYSDLANQGDPRAQYALSLIYEEGLGRNIYDPDSALTWLRRAAVGGYAPAQYRLGRYYYEGEVLARDLLEAERWWGEASIRNMHVAWHDLLALYPLDGADDPLRPMLRDMGQNFLRLRDRAAAGADYAMTLLGIFYETGAGTDADASRAARWYRQAADEDNAHGQFYLARLLAAAGRYDEARELLLRAAEQDLPEAQLELAEMYEAGLGVEVDMREALFWTMAAFRIERDIELDRNALEARMAALPGEAVGDIRARVRAFAPRNQPQIIQAARGLWSGF